MEIVLVIKYESRQKDGTSPLSILFMHFISLYENYCKLSLTEE
jgi:hypothetical protein